MDIKTALLTRILKQVEDDILDFSLTSELYLALGFNKEDKSVTILVCGELNEIDCNNYLHVALQHPFNKNITSTKTIRCAKGDNDIGNKIGDWLYYELGVEEDIIQPTLVNIKNTWIKGLKELRLIK